MTEKEAKTAQFEDWLRTVAVYGAPDAISPAGKWMLTAWQASRQQALSEAALVNETAAAIPYAPASINAGVRHGLLEAAAAIRSLTSPAGDKA